MLRSKGSVVRNYYFNIKKSVRCLELKHISICVPTQFRISNIQTSFQQLSFVVLQKLCTQKDSAYSKVSELVTRFDEQYASYKKSDYNETLTSRDFIDPFFRTLGWNIDNQQGFCGSLPGSYSRRQGEGERSNQSSGLFIPAVGRKEVVLC